MNFRKQLEYACQSVNVAITKMMVKVGGLKHCRRLLLTRVVPTEALEMEAAEFGFSTDSSDCSRYF